MKVPMKRYLWSALLGSLLGVAVNVAAAPLLLADRPLFLGYTVNPNVFFMLDDSGSMDFEITTGAHWDACRYDNSHPATGTNCPGTLRSDGNWYAWRTVESKRSTLTSYANWVVGQNTFVFMFDNAADNHYGNRCEDVNTSFSSCVSSSTYNLQAGSIYCTGNNCNAPSGGFCYQDGSTRTCRNPVGTGTTVTINWRQSMYAKDWRPYSSDFNVTYYNPQAEYKPWMVGGTRMADASFAAARNNPQNGQIGYSITRDLGGVNGVPFRNTAPDNTGFVYEVWEDTHGYSESTGSGTVAPDRTDRLEGANGMIDVWDTHYRYVVTGGINGTITRYTVEYDVTSSGLTEKITNTESLTTDGVRRSSDNELRTVADVQQNIANWYQYSRKRMLLTKGAVAEVVNSNRNFRYGLSVINNTGDTDGTNIFVEMPAAAEVEFSTHNSSLVTSLFDYKQAALGTPLRFGLDNAGRYFSGQTLYNSAGNLSTTTRTSPITEACQQNFTVLFTDGYWSDCGDPKTDAIGDHDSDGYSHSYKCWVGNTQYTKSDNSTLADVARYYADRDIDTTKADSVPVSSTGNTTTFQHMVTYTVAFGVNGELRDDNDDDLVHVPTVHVDSVTNDETEFTASVAAEWGDNPWTSNTGKIDDMWHAAYNSTGDFISARTASDLVDGLKNALNSIGARTGSSAAVAASSGSYQSSTRLFLATFYADNWYGDLVAYPLIAGPNNTVVISPTTTWSAADKLDLLVAGAGYSDNRKIVSYNPAIVDEDADRQGTGVPFRFPSSLADADSLGGLGLAQIAHLLPFATTTTAANQITANSEQGQALLDWLRGDTSKEGTVYKGSLAAVGYEGIAYRDRTKVLGDIVESSPQYVGASDRFYPDSIEPGEGNEYSAFREANEDREPTLYVGANDGMLHAFDAAPGAAGGNERFAYVPNSLFKRLKGLANTQYEHKYFVNSTVEINDVFINGNWRTVLVGGLGAGGQGIYALDVTDPSAANEAAVASKVLWEFTDANYVADKTAGDVGSNGDPNLGYTFSRPQLVKMANGKWMAVFGNGYNNTEADDHPSTTGYAYLYFVEIATGKLLRRIEVPLGSTDTPNGLATVTSVDLNGDYVADYFYGGDLRGRLWRFDVSNPSESEWKLARSNQPVFVTQSNQPITTKPSVARHPSGSGVMVFFGTGQYLELDDAQTGNQSTQSFYGIWDNINVSGTYPIPLASLQQQTIVEEVIHPSGAPVRITSNNNTNWNSSRGWYMDLMVVGSGGNNGELIMTDSIVRSDRVIFVSAVPANTACEAGGSSWIYELDYVDGSRLPFSPIDVNNDGSIDAADNVTSNSLGTLAGGGFKKNGIITTPTILADAQSGDKEHKVFSSSVGTLMSMGESTGGIKGRRSWRQLR